MAQILTNGTGCQAPNGHCCSSSQRHLEFQNWYSSMSSNEFLSKMACVVVTDWKTISILERKQIFAYYLYTNTFFYLFHAVIIQLDKKLAKNLCIQKNTLINKNEMGKNALNLYQKFCRISELFSKISKPLHLYNISKSCSRVVTAISLSNEVKFLAMSCLGDSFWGTS